VMFFSLSSAMVMFTCDRAGWSGGDEDWELCSGRSGGNSCESSIDG
jgi:hypothetical protein